MNTMKPFGFIYIFTFVCAIVFLLTRRELRVNVASVGSRKEKALHGLNLVSFGWLLTWTFIILFMETLLITSPVHYWELGSEFMNDAVSLNPLFAIFTTAFNSMILFFGGWKIDPRESHMPVNSVSGKWLIGLIGFFTLAGIIGVLSGLLI